MTTPIRYDPELLIADGEIIICAEEIVGSLEKFAAVIRAGHYDYIHAHIAHEDNPEAVCTTTLTVTVT